MGVIHDYGMPFTDQAGDRKYNSSAFRDYFSNLIEDGIIGAEAGELIVKPQASPNKSVYVDTGSIFIQGAVRILSAAQTIQIADNALGNPRIDRIVARLNYTSRKIEFVVLQGTPSAIPIPPALTRNTMSWDLALADITLASGYTTITAGVINDQRANYSLCGYFAYKAKPAWYPINQIPMDVWMYTHFKAALTTQQRIDIEASSTLMAIINANTMSDSLKTYKTDSYMAFCGNVNDAALNAGFGQNNVDLVDSVGYQLAMYAWFKGDSKTTYPFAMLIASNSLQEAIDNALSEIFSSDNVLSIIHASSYAKSLLYTAQNSQRILQSQTILAKWVSRADIVDMVRDSPSIRACFDSRRVVLETPSSSTWIVPAGITQLYVHCIGGGGNSNNRNGGGIRSQIMAVTPGQVISYSVPARGSMAAAVFGTLSAPGAEASQPGQSGIFIKRSGNGYVSGTNSGSWSFGIGGWGGGPGIGYNAGSGGGDLGTGGGGSCAFNATTPRGGGGGGGYGGGSASGGSDAGQDLLGGQGVICINY